jgi:hypothetical protein
MRQYVAGIEPVPDHMVARHHGPDIAAAVIAQPTLFTGDEVNEIDVVSLAAVRFPPDHVVSIDGWISLVELALHQRPFPAGAEVVQIDVIPIVRATPATSPAGAQ